MVLESCNYISLVFLVFYHLLSYNLFSLRILHHMHLKSMAFHSKSSHAEVIFDECYMEHLTQFMFHLRFLQEVDQYWLMNKLYISFP